MNAELIKRAKEKDDEAISEIYRLTYSKAYGIALSTVKNPEDAQDILQESYLTAFGKIEQLENPERFEAWLHQIVSNRCKDFLRKKKPILFSELESDEENDSVLDFEDESETFCPEAVLDKSETTHALCELLDMLPEDQRLAVIMYYESELKISEIAKALGESENTIKSRLFYAKKKMKAEIDEREKQGNPLFGILPIGFTGLLNQLKPSFDFSQAGGSDPMRSIPESVQRGDVLKTIRTLNSLNVKEEVFEEGAKAIGKVVKKGAKGAAKATGKHLARKIIAGTLAAATITTGGVMIAKPEVREAVVTKFDEVKDSIVDIKDNIIAALPVKEELPEPVKVVKEFEKAINKYDFAEAFKLFSLGGEEEEEEWVVDLSAELYSFIMFTTRCEYEIEVISYDIYDEYAEVIVDCKVMMSGKEEERRQIVVPLQKIYEKWYITDEEIGTIFLDVFAEKVIDFMGW